MNEGRTRRLAGSHKEKAPYRNRQIVVVLAIAVLGIAALFAVAGASASTGGVGTGGSGASSSSTSSGGNKYSRAWRRFSTSNKRWAHKTSKCESGQNPKAVSPGGTYRGAFQFSRRTWRHAPKSPGGDPIKYSWKTQAVVAVFLKRKAGASQWPVCGH